MRSALAGEAPERGDRRGAARRRDARSATSAPRAPSATRRCSPRAGHPRGRAASRCRRSTTTVIAVHRRRGRARARADRELARGRRSTRRSTRSRSRRADVAIVGELVLADPPLPDRARRGRARRDRDGRLAPAGRWRSARASCARACRGARCARRPRPPRPCAASPSRTAPWAALGTRRAAELYGCAVLRDGRRRRARQRDALRVARRRRQRRPRADGARAVEDVARLLGRRRRSPGWLVRCLSEFAFRGVNLTRIESRPRAGASATTCSSSTSRAATAEPPSPTRSQACAHTRGRARARLLSGRVDPLRTRGRRGPLHCRADRHGQASVPPGHRGPRRLTSTGGAGVTRGRVLVLNATFEPINVCTVRRATVLLLKEKAEVARARGLGAALRAHGAPAPGRDPPRDLRPRPARHAPAQDHPPRRLRPRRLGLPVLRRALEPHGRPRDPALQGRRRRAGTTSSPRARRATAARATTSPTRSACTRAGSPRAAARTSSSTSPARRSRRRGDNGCPPRAPWPTQPE